MKKFLLFLFFLLLAYLGYVTIVNMESNKSFFVFNKLVKQHSALYEGMLGTSMQAEVVDEGGAIGESQCNIVRNKQGLVPFKQTYGDTFCPMCDEVDFKTYSLVAMPTSELIDGPFAKKGFEHYAYRDDDNERVVYFTASKKFKQFHFDILAPFRQNTKKYRIQDSAWMMRIPKIPDRYTLDCRAFTTG